MLLEIWKGVEEREVHKKTGEVRQKTSYIDDVIAYLFDCVSLCLRFTSKFGDFVLFTPPPPCKMSPY